MKKFISFSGGVESTTMCILYGKGATAIWSDTDAEHAVMYERIAKVIKYCYRLHGGDFRFKMIRPATVKHKGANYVGLENLVKAYQFMPSGQARYCTKFFKSQAIDNVFINEGECELMIGFNVDEQGRTGSLQMMPNVTYTTPLIDDGHTRDDCEEILMIHGMHPKFPVYMSRGGCKFCFFKSEKEYRAMYHLNYQEYSEVQKLEEDIQDRRKKFYSIMANGKSLRQLATECENEKQFLVSADWNELYKSLKKETSCGAFCHR